MYFTFKRILLSVLLGVTFAGIWRNIYSYRFWGVEPKSTLRHLNAEIG